MKRKLNENDIPEEVEESDKTRTKAPSSFLDLSLDPRLLQAVTKEKFAVPTPVQAQAIPLALSGKDVLGMSDGVFSQGHLTDRRQRVPKRALAKLPPMFFRYYNRS